jgi:hypothetical protein
MIDLDTIAGVRERDHELRAGCQRTAGVRWTSSG